MNEKTPKIVSIASIVIAIVSVLAGRAFLMTGDVNMLMKFYTVLILGLLPLTAFIGCLILTFIRSKIMPVYAVLAAVISYVIPIIDEIYASESGYYEFSPIMVALAVIPPIVGIVVGLIAGLIRRSIKKA